MIRPIFMSLALMFPVLFSLSSCSQDANSRPNYVHKPAPQNGAAAKIGGDIVTEGELYKGIESDLYEAEMKVYEIKMSKLKGLILEKMMDKDPNKKGLSNDEYLDKYITKNVAISKKDIEKFIEERQIPKEHINDQMRDRVQKFLEMEKKKDAVEAWIAKQTTNSPVEVYFAKPARPMFDVKVGDAPYTGRVDAKVTLVEYSDFQCPYCAKGSDIIHDLQKKYGDKLKIVFKNYPLPFHNHAKVAAEAGLCANEQNTKYFWKLHDYMFKNQDKLDQDNLVKAGAEIGLNKDQFEKCITSHKYQQKVEESVAEGQEIGVKSTPTFFINGQLINGAQPIEVFADLIDEEMKK